VTVSERILLTGVTTVCKVMTATRWFDFWLTVYMLSLICCRDWAWSVFNRLTA